MPAMAALRAVIIAAQSASAAHTRTDSMAGAVPPVIAGLGGGQGMWASGGGAAGRAFVPPMGLTGPNLVAAGVDGAGSVTQVAFQGRAAPAHPAAGLPLAEAVEELGRTALCVGVPDGALVGFAEGSDTHRARVCELDAGVHPWNDLARGGSFFASANNKERGRSVPAAHALSATVTRTARHPLCPGYAGGRKGRPLPVTCKKCTIYGATLRTGLGRQKIDAAIRTHPQAGPLYRERRTDPSSSVPLNCLRADEKKERLAKARQQKFEANSKLQDQVVAARERGSLTEVVLSAEQEDDFRTILNDPRVLEAAAKAFAGGDNPVGEAFFYDAVKRNKLSDARGMRWSPMVLRKSLQLWTQANTKAWDELAGVLKLPSDRTLRGYRSQQRGGGFNYEAMNNIVSKLLLDQAAEMAAAQSQTEREQLQAQHEVRLPTRPPAPCAHGADSRRLAGRNARLHQLRQHEAPARLHLEQHGQRN